MFAPLLTEISHWQRLGKDVELWWRDDDAQKQSPQLTRLIALSQQHQVPVALATIPFGVELNLKNVTAENELVTIIQHGYSHHNHALPTQRKMELGLHRPLQTILDELTRGRQLLLKLFTDSFVPILVPPWNRIDPKIVAQLSEIGFIGLSDLGPRNQYFTTLEKTNVHVDIINWKTRRFAGASQAISQLVNHLEAKRLGNTDINEAAGIMTHHLVHDEACWDFLDQLFTFLSASPHVKLLSVSSVFHIQN